MSNLSTEKLLKNIIIGGLFLIPFLPFIVSTTMFFPFITGKNFAFRIIVEIVFALWLALVMFDKNYLPKKSNLLISVLSFIGIIAIADFAGQNAFKSFWSNYERMEGLVSLLHVLAYFVMLISVFNEKIWKYFFNTIFATSIGLFIYGALQIFGKLAIHQGGGRIDASFGNSAYFAVYMLMITFLAGLYFFRHKFGNNLQTWFYGSISVIAAFMLFQTATRGTLIGLVMGILVAAALVAKFGEGQEKKTASYIVGSVAALILLFILFKNIPIIRSHPVLGRFSELSISSIMNQPRYMVWNMAWEGFKERPILGWGQENFNLVFNKHYDPSMYAQEPWFDRAHNVFFDWLIAGGILGLLSYLFIFFFAIRAIWSQEKIKKFSLLDRSVLTGLLVGYFIHNFFVFDNLLSYVMFFTVLAYIYHETSGTLVKEKSKPVPLFDKEFATYVATSIVIIGFCGTMYFINIKPILASTTLIKALSSRNMTDMIDNFKKVISYNTFGSTEAREQLVQRAMGLSRDPNLDPTSKQTLFLLAREEMAKQIEKFPKDARYRVFQGALYSSYGFFDDAIRELAVANELSPAKQNIMFELVSSLLNKGDVANALIVAERAFRLEENYFDAQRIYAVALIYNKEIEKAEALFADSSGERVIVVDDRLINAYAAIKRFDRVIEIWKKKIEANPTNHQYHIFLSASYLADGQRSKSIEELKKAAELNPAFAPQAEIYIKDIRAGRTPQ
jgi:O-antigen ligase/tetratricopeptide (TPR) repeat protein